MTKADLMGILKRLKSFVKEYPNLIPAVYVDVDGTLLNPDESVNRTVTLFLKWLRKELGSSIRIIIWSSGGEGYARRACDKAKLDERTVDFCLSKPYIAVDDMGHHGVLMVAQVLNYKLEEEEFSAEVPKPEDIF